LSNDKKILILGVTASGKSRLSFELAKHLKTDIISIDSMKVYRRMDIGTAKPSAERRKQVKYHLIDIVEPSETFSVDKFLELTDQTIQNLQSENKQVIAAGGTSMYIKTMLYGMFEGPSSDETIRQELKQQAQATSLAHLHKELAQIDPQAADRIHPNDEKRIIRALEVYKITGKPISYFQTQFAQPAKSDWLVIGIRREKEIESRRINARVKKMVDMGLIDEVKSLLSEEKPLSPQAAYAIGYAEIISHLKNEMSLEDAIEKIKINTRRLAKGQRTWFKRFETVNWIDAKENDTIEDLLTQANQIIQKNLAH
jgi:tRNA dimethylallyltransferase